VKVRIKLHLELSCSLKKMQGSKMAILRRVEEEDLSAALSIHLPKGQRQAIDSKEGNLEDLAV